ncbi:DUF4625 domain-containing protein [Zobellia sp. 1_MG-2023]|uniref:DUF4625 domain-containing protein n=1 Tax=Zobellia sp. 1_MG-2023 TaxID=3062626 RepID=UPI0026E41FFE|nr:DUF4625 domain-containing protein [Zobellia sp. 1_MG-2023]MDO6821286.1 DUF4625 domain-containing protein [Zobellia sp. 1_MG-2023]
MKFSIKYFYLASFILLTAACSNDNSDDIDEEKPTISVNYTEGFPQGCTLLTRGETYNFRAMVTDNSELAAYSIDIHHNFDHHTHDDQVTKCELGEVQSPVNPLIFVENYTIEGSLTSYEINISVTIPNDVDTGDYHCAYSVTDATGWQGRTSIDIKIVE